MSSTPILPSTSTVSASAALAAKSAVGNAAVSSLLVTPSRKQARRRRILNAVTTLVALASMVTSAVAMYWFGNPVVYLAFSIPLLVTAPLTLIQKLRLKGMSPLWLLRQTLSHVRSEVNRLGELNDMFSNEISRLEREQEKLRNVQQQLETTVAASGGDMRVMTRLLKEYAQIQREIKHLIAAEELQQLMAAVLHSDRNGDGQFSAQEMEVLMVRLQAFNVADKARLRTVFHMASSKSLNHIYQAAAEEFTAYDCADIGSEDDEESGVMKAFDYVPWTD